MPSVEYLKQFVSTYLKEHSQFKYYVCNKIHGYNGSYTTADLENMYYCAFLEDFYFDYSKGKYDFSSNTGVYDANYFLFKSGKLVEFVDANYKISNIYQYNSKDLTYLYTNVPNDYDSSKFINNGYDFLQNFTISSDNSSTGNSSVNVDMTNTNNILFTIALILCVTLLLSFIRKLFNRGVTR